MFAVSCAVLYAVLCVILYVVSCDVHIVCCFVCCIVLYAVSCAVLYAVRVLYCVLYCRVGDIQSGNTDRIKQLSCCQGYQEDRLHRRSRQKDELKAINNIAIFKKSFIIII